MARVEESLDIQAPIEVVFAALTDPRRAPEWNPNVVEVAEFSGYPVQVGTTWVQVVMMLGRPIRLACGVKEYQPPRSGLIEVSGAQRGLIWTRCEDRGGAVRVIQGMEFTPPGGVLGRLGVNVMKGQIQKELRETMVRQRTALESAGGLGGSRTGG